MVPFRLTTLLFLLSFAWITSAQAPASVKEEFVGSTPCDPVARQFLGGLATNAPCHYIAWDVTLFKSEKPSDPHKYAVTATYWLPGKNDTNQLEQGATVKVEGTWEIARGTKSNPNALVYRLHSKNAAKPVSLAQIGQHLLHFMNEEKTLRIGNAGWSYTLNRKGIAPEN
jgi:hypothetical protein